MANRQKFAWLHSLRTCCLSGREDIQIAHLHEQMWSGMARKVSDVLVLPLSAPLHAAQHRHPIEFWPNALPCEDPKDWAVRLHDIWESRDLEGADLLLRDMQGKANRGYLAQFLARAA
jgi:hypothetical protein